MDNLLQKVKDMDLVSDGTSIEVRVGGQTSHTMLASQSQLAAHVQAMASQHIELAQPPITGSSAMDYDASELADNGLHRQFGYSSLQSGRWLCKTSQEQAGHAHNRFASYVYGFSEDGQGWYPSEAFIGTTNI
eukprot:11221363-Karenia_brevis.AAC.1